MRTPYVHRRTDSWGRLWSTTNSPCKMSFIWMRALKRSRRFTPSKSHLCPQLVGYWKHLPPSCQPPPPATMLPEVLQIPSHLLQPPHLLLYQKLAPLSQPLPRTLHRLFLQTQGLTLHIVSAIELLSSNNVLQGLLPRIRASRLLLVFGVCWFGDTNKITFFHVLGGTLYLPSQNKK